MLSRNLDKAKKAYKEMDSIASREAHESKRFEPHKKHGKYIKSVIYGGLDGIITTCAVVAGVAGANLSAGIVLILGFANLIADGISMAVGDYLSTKAEKEYQKSERERESWEVENYPDGEKKEMIEIYTSKGIAEKDAKNIVEILAQNKKAWVDVMMVEELGILEEDESPLKNAIATFLSFFIFGFLPLLTYVLSVFIPIIKENAFILASVLTGITLFTLGALKVRITEMNWFKSGFEMFAVGGLAASAAYIIGSLLQGFANY
jgi:vacuolar iron transporter family protein